MTTLPYGAMPQDSAEFMLGTVAVTPVFLESNGQLDTSTQDWTDQLIQDTLQKIQTGLNWWVDLLAAQHTVHSLEFTIDTTYATSPVATRYEPISRVSNDFALWVQEFVTGQGFDTPGGLDADIRAFNDHQRQKMHTDWSFTMFVINSNNDADGSFAAGGSFPRAFGFAGGLFFVSPSTRPASTFAHETGHIFWAKDEYLGGASYSERRGYYNTPNSNAADNPAQGFVQQPSIMASDDLLDIAWQNHVSPPSTLAMIGWQDSDQDGIFDVLDVPLQLTGTGYYDLTAEAYKFRGFAKVGVLPNLNPSGLRNDITLNRISSVQYRIDNGEWKTAKQPDVYEADLDLSIPVAGSAQSIDIRAIDARTGITSNVFHGRLARPDAVTVPGVNGFVWTDVNKNGLQDAGESGEAGWTVEVLSSSEQPLDLRHVVEPDSLPNGALNPIAAPGISITAIGADTDGRVGIFADAEANSNSKTFYPYSRASQNWVRSWNGSSRRMQVDFRTPTSVVEIDAIGISAESYARLEAYDAAGNLLSRFTTPKLVDGQVMTMRVESSVGAIASVRVGGHANSTVRLDNLRYGPETRVTTQEKGKFSIPDLPSGSYLVRASSAGGHYLPSPNSGQQQAVDVVAGSVSSDVDFAFSPMSARLNRFDVNDDQLVSALDVLLIVNDINEHGPHEVPPNQLLLAPFIDVNGDAHASALDALLIINFINSEADREPESDSAARGAIAQAPSAAPPVLAASGRGAAAEGEDRGGLACPTDAGLAHDAALLAMPEVLGDSAKQWLAFSDSVPGRRASRPTR